MRQHFASPRVKKAIVAQTALGWLGSDQQGANVLATANMLLSVEQAAKQVLPPALAQAFRVARIDRQQITLAVPSAAYASRLRQMAPRILALLASAGWNLSEISVRVQAGLHENRTKTARTKEAIPLDEKALDAFGELQKNLRPGPLADAVTRLLSHHRAE